MFGFGLWPVGFFANRLRDGTKDNTFLSQEAHLFELRGNPQVSSRTLVHSSEITILKSSNLKKLGCKEQSSAGGIETPSW